MNYYHYIHRRLPALLAALLPLSLMAQGIHTGAGIHVVVSGAPAIVLNDAALVNDGDISAGNSTFVFAGSAGDSRSFIGGSRPVAFYRLGLRTPAGLQLNNNISVAGILDMHSGMLELNNHTLDLGATGSIQGERNEAHITGDHGGTVTATALLNAPQSVNPGNIGVEITSPASMGLTTITRGHVAQDNAAGSIHRYFNIAPSANANLHASLRFYYFDDELAGYDRQALSLFAGRNGQHSWSLAGRDNSYSNGIGGWVIKNDLSELNRFTLAIPASTAIKTSVLLKASAFAFPNPSRDGFTLALAGDTEKDMVIGLYNQHGQLLDTKKIHCLPGASQLQWDIGRYAAGVYYLQFHEAGIKNITIVKQ